MICNSTPDTKSFSKNGNPSAPNDLNSSHRSLPRCSTLRLWNGLEAGDWVTSLKPLISTFLPLSKPENSPSSSFKTTLPSTHSHSPLNLLTSMYYTYLLLPGANHAPPSSCATRQAISLSFGLLPRAPAKTFCELSFRYSRLPTLNAASTTPHVAELPASSASVRGLQMLTTCVLRTAYCTKTSRTPFRALYRRRWQTRSSLLAPFNNWMLQRLMLGTTCSQLVTIPKLLIWLRPFRSYVRQTVPPRPSLPLSHPTWSLRMPCHPHLPRLALGATLLMGNRPRNLHCCPPPPALLLAWSAQHAIRMALTLLPPRPR